MSTTDDRQRERISLDLIEFVSRHTIDDDYEAVAARGGRRTGARKRTATVAVLVTMALFGVLLAVASSQTSRGEVAEEESRRELIDQIQDRRAVVDASRSQADELRREVSSLQTEVLVGDEGGGPLGTLRRLSVISGAAAVTGPGVRVVVDDKPDATDPLDRVLDSDLQRLVNGLWVAGAEAISINGIRLSTLSPIRSAAGAITVDFRSLSPPYTVEAIGDPDTMPAAFAESTSGAGWYQLQQDPGLRFEMTVEDSLTMRANTQLSLQHALPEGSRPRNSEEPAP